MISRNLATVAFVIGTVLSATPAAQACRDCPFPMGTRSGRWMMPNGRFVIEIQNSDDGSEIEITLVDPKTGYILASGTGLRHSNAKFDVQMRDGQGHEIHGRISYLDETREHIQAKFDCSDCAIQPYIYETN